MKHYSDQPRIGFYKMRQVRNGPFVAVAIGPRCPMVEPDYYIDPEDWCTPYDRSRRLQAWVDGKGFMDPWKVYTRCLAIDEAEFLFLAANSQWARDYAPAAPEASPAQPIDLGELPPLF